jgi:hypothetical protein
VIPKRAVSMSGEKKEVREETDGENKNRAE